MNRGVPSAAPPDHRETPSASAIPSTLLALVAFAANSVLCRLALTTTRIDPASFTTIRLATGAVVLGLLLRMRGDRVHREQSSWGPALGLALYAAPFAFAYRFLAAGTGALLLFAAVQITMIVGGIWMGRPPGTRQWCGLVLALAGLTYLVLPGLAAPSPAGAMLMLAAGAAWGVYSLAGRATTDPLAQSAANFARALPLVLVVSLVAWPAVSLDAHGVLLAAASGGLASGLGYAAWYQALPVLTPPIASLVQLAVPAMAALGGVAFLNEPLTARLIAASVLILGGIGIGLGPKRRP